MSNKNENAVVTPEFTVCFPAVFRPKEFNGKEKYQITMVFDKSSDLKNLKKLVKKVAEDSFGGMEGVVSPFKDGNDKDIEAYPVFKDKIYIQASTQFSVGLVDQKRQPILNEEDFYAGCTARAQVSAFSWTYLKKKGISLNLLNVQKMSDGEKLGGSKPITSIFDEVEVEESKDDFDFDL